jgi:hypothetical protein
MDWQQCTAVLLLYLSLHLNETYSKVSIGENLSDAFQIQNGLKPGDAFITIAFCLALEYAITKVQENQEGLEVTRVCQLLVYIDDVNMLGKT